MIPGLVIRKAVAADIPQIIDLVTHLYEYRRGKPFFLWQCFENYRPAVLFVAEEKREIAGMYGIQKVQTNHGLSGGQVSWINIAEHRRGGGLFKEMSIQANGCFPDLDFTFIFANADAESACERSLGMHFIGALKRLILEGRNMEPPVQGKVEQIEIRTPFREFPCPASLVSFQREEGYRQWRYAQSTEYRYTKVSLATGEYAIVKLFQGEGARPVVGDIVDFACDLLNSDSLELLLRAACSQLWLMGSSAITTWAVPGTPLRAAAERIGFTESDHGCSFGIRTMTPASRELLDFGKWHLVQSDATNY